MALEQYHGLPFQLNRHGTVHQRTVKYDSKAFPRFNHLQSRLRDFQQAVKYLPPDTLEEPHIRFLCDRTFTEILEMNNSQFSVNGISGECLGEDNLVNSAIIVTVCILQPDNSGELSVKDYDLLEVVKNDIHSMVFVINTTCKVFTPNMLEKCSKSISHYLDPFSSENTIFNRLFLLNSIEISVRISLYFEKILLEKLPVSIKTDKDVQKQKIPQLNNQVLENVLKNGPLDNNKCKEFLRNRAVEYHWEGSNTYRLSWRINRVKHKVKDYLCECLSKEIALTLVRTQNEYLHALNKDVANELDKRIYATTWNINEVYLIWGLTIFITMLLAGPSGVITGLLAIVVSLFYSVNVMDEGFRNNIADCIHGQIMSRRDEIIQSVIPTFLDIHSEYARMCDILNVFAKRNKIDTYFHEYKITTERNMNIKACGLFGKIVRIYIEREFTREDSIQRYISKYHADVSIVHICEYHVISIKKHSLKSGLKLLLGNPFQSSYGTLSFLLQDEKSQYYCATCNHVIAMSNTHYIQPDFGTLVSIDFFYKSQDVDFALLKLRNHKITCSHGIRFGENEFKSAKLLENGLLPNENDIVYKWGATTAKTFGKYLGVVCSRKSDVGNYEIETFIIEGLDGQFAQKGDSGSLVCIKPDEVVFTSYMAAFILIGEQANYDGVEYTNTYSCYRVSVPLMEMKKTESCKNLKPCF